MVLQYYRETGVTVLNNVFIDQYIADANGEYVKVYLFLMRAAQSGIDFSVSSLADALDHTEKDILRALRYWQKHGLLTMEEAHGKVTALALTSPESTSGSALQSAHVAAEGKASSNKDHSAAQHSAQASASDSAAADEKRSADKSTAAKNGTAAVSSAGSSTVSVSAPDSMKSTVSVSDVPAKKELTAAERNAITSQEEIQTLLYVVEQYFNRPMTSVEINDLLYFYDTLHFSFDLIVTLVECCLEKGDRGPRYMETVAQSWYKKGITTPLEAVAENKRHNEDYYVILRALGISDHRPIDKEIDAMDRWLHEYGFSTEIISEACERTIMRIHKPEFGYVETILRSWYEGGVKEPSDIQALDAAHNTEAAASAAAASPQTSESAGGKARRTPRSQASRFTNFDQRSYDWNALAEQALVKQNSKENTIESDE